MWKNKHMHYISKINTKIITCRKRKVCALHVRNLHKNINYIKRKCMTRRVIMSGKIKHALHVKN